MAYAGESPGRKRRVQESQVVKKLTLNSDALNTKVLTKEAAVAMESIKRKWQAAWQTATILMVG